MGVQRRQWKHKWAGRAASGHASWNVEEVQPGVGKRPETPRLSREPWEADHQSRRAFGVTARLGQIPRRCPHTLVLAGCALLEEAEEHLPHAASFQLPLLRKLHITRIVMEKCWTKCCPWTQTCWSVNLELRGYELITGMLGLCESIFPSDFNPWF